MAPRAGETICGQLQVTRALPDRFGAPAFGEVFAGLDLEQNREVWITIIDGAFFPSSMDVSSFMAQANGLTTLRHPSLSGVLLVDREEGYCVVGSEALPDSRPLAALEDELYDDPGEVGRCSVSLARALSFLHRKGQLHGMLSSTTVVEWEGSYMLWQHGVAPACNKDALVARCRRDQKNIYAPELLKGTGALTPAVDVYAWAVTVARLASPGDPLEAVHAALDGVGELALPEGMERVVKRCLNPDPDRRPRDAVHLLSLIEEVGLSRSGAHKLVTPGASISNDGLSFSELNLAGESATELSADDIMMDESGDSVPRPSPAAIAAAQRAAKPRAKPTSRPRPKTAKLSTLAQSHAGLDVGAQRNAATPVGETGAEPDLLELAESAPLPLNTEARDVPRPARYEPDDDPRRAAPVSVDPEGKDERPFQIPRTPGPHGPRPAPMAATLALASLLLPGLAFLHLYTADALTLGVEVPTLPGATTPAAGDEPGATPHDDGVPALAPDLGGPMVLKLDLPTLEAPPTAAQCPSGMVALSRKVCMDAGEYPGLSRAPLNNVTHREAAAACEERGARLCRRQEFVSACQGRGGNRYPYGPAFEPDRCNTASVAGFPQEVGLSGAYGRCATPSGIFDLVGNVGEWAAQGVAMGGDSQTPGETATCTASGRPPPGYRGRDLGFRCCLDLAPAPAP